MTRVHGLLRPVKTIWDQPSHPVWVGFQFIAVRLLTALKFLLIAKLLGPTAMGHISVALLGLAAAEALTDLGLGQAIIQQPGELTLSQRRTSWTLLLLRGCGIALFLVLSAPLLARLLGSPSASPLLILCALVPLIRNAASIELYLIQRDRNFKVTAFITTVPSVLDFVFSMVFTLMTQNPASLFLGLILGELVKTYLSFLVFKDRPRFKLDMESVRSLNTYGRWIWGSSLITFFLNQLDKILAGSLFGAFNLGLYQMSSRTAQLGVSDLATAASQYLFPTFAERFRKNPVLARRFFEAVLTLGAALAILATSMAWMFAPTIVSILLGPKWFATVPIFRILSITMTVGAIIAILVAYTRAVGQPKWVTTATLLQAVIYVPLLIVLSHRFGVIGLAISTVVGTSVAMTYLLVQALPGRQGTQVWLRLGGQVLAVFLLILSATVFPTVLVRGLSLLGMVLAGMAFVYRPARNLRLKESS